MLRLALTRSSPFKPSFYSLLSTHYSTSSPLVSVERHSPSIAIVKLQSPPVNALNYSILSQLNEAVTTLEADKSVRGFLLCSSFPNVFSGGIDLPVFLSPRDELEKFWGEFQKAFYTIYSSRLISVCAINGSAPAGGTIFALACHFRVMASHHPQTGKPYVIGLNEVSIGLPVPRWIIHHFEEVVGKQNSLRCISKGALLNSKEAMSINMIDEEVENADQAMKKGLLMLQERVQNDQYSLERTLLNARKESGAKILKMMNSTDENAIEFLEREEFKTQIREIMKALANKKKK